MKHGSLFSGIGGFDLAAEWMGWENVFHCEWNEFGQKILKYYWPKAISYADITKTDFSIHRGAIDILTGGFPCQPYSMAGKRKGKEDDRHLWPEMLRAIREIQPRYVLGENVLGLVNWNGGLVFNEVQADLEAEGYEVFPYVLPACAVNAPHRRDRVWFVAYSESCRNRGELRGLAGKDESEWKSEKYRKNHLQFGNNGKVELTSNTESNEDQRRRQSGLLTEFTGFNVEGIVANAKNKDGRLPIGAKQENSKFGSYGKYATNDRWQDFPTQSPICTRNDELSARLDGITFSKWRNESIKAGGNAVVPNMVFEIFKAIEQYENLYQ